MTRHFGSLVRFSAEELAEACNDFDEDNVVGEGGYSEVFKGVLSDGTPVAIKRMKVPNLTPFPQESERGARSTLTPCPCSHGVSRAGARGTSTCPGYSGLALVMGILRQLAEKIAPCIWYAEEQPGRKPPN